MSHSLDHLPLSNSFAALGEAYFSRVLPTPFASPAELLHFNANAAALLDLAPASHLAPEFAEIFGGAKPLPGGEPLAMAYSGHQFGQYVSQLGDGRAIVLGETTNARGERWEIQLKGCGKTPYSRDGDGRAVLRSTIREYLCSEAIHGLGIPTTRALCIVGSKDAVYRERIETAAILTRLAPSHVRFGSFELLFYNNEHQHIAPLADFIIDHHYPELSGAPDRYVRLLETVVARTARLIAQWQSVGFMHGVMNSDNMSILGLTLDYGPYGFMEAYDPHHICNHSDHMGRYAYDQQPDIGLFNLSCLAQAFLPIMEVDAAQSALKAYESIYSDQFEQLMLSKLGLNSIGGNKSAFDLIGKLMDLMEQQRVDFTLLFRSLCDVSIDNEDMPDSLAFLFREPAAIKAWLGEYRALLTGNTEDDATRSEAMRKTNPKYVLRNYMAQIAIDKAEKDADYSEIDRLMTLLQSPFDEHPEMAHYAAAGPEWARDLQVSCSS